ncbi:hypothetical protein OMP40_24340 [Cohnella rhizosphaerae]|uniref:ATP-dependent helicase/deoxyribonuclease subunit B N-terminal domain-containing protein n=1 Tax=Cohnella rhizosphaerae TaxID=1457232 RepID=A0A9X4KWL3_9BACL|nr:hypothetical protein [Cohnella rhizosphaerae]MDG0812133.1 hypothetical protein [Cohnella rhizosphaerae]
MKLRLIAGRSGSGKSHLIKTEIAERIAREPAGPPLLLIVPEQATFQTEYAFASSPGARGFMRLQVSSFRRLAFRVMQESGGSAVVPIGDNGKSMLVHKALVRRQGELKLYRSGTGGAGLAERIGEQLTEWKRYGTSPDALRSVPLAAGAASTGGGGAGRQGAGGCRGPAVGQAARSLAVIRGRRARAGRSLSGRRGCARVPDTRGAFVRAARRGGDLA